MTGTFSAFKTESQKLLALFLKATTASFFALKSFIRLVVGKTFAAV